MEEIYSSTRGSDNALTNANVLGEFKLTSLTAIIFALSEIKFSSFSPKQIRSLNDDKLDKAVLPGMIPKS